MSGSTTSLPVVFGAMTIGSSGVDGIRVSDLTEANRMLDVFQLHGHSEVDTARLYGRGSTETYLADANWQGRNLKMGTKLYPNARTRSAGKLSYTLQAADVRQGLKDSLEALGATKLDLWYLHGPDRSTPLEETLQEVDSLYREGYFDRFGISNYMSWEVAAICEICERHGWIKPTVYQGVYNALHRAIEPELMRCLRQYGISLYSFQPLAGGFLTSRYRRGMSDTDYVPGSRFDPSHLQGKLHHVRYVNDAYFDALEELRAAAAKHQLTEAECALRWLSHHSAMSKEKGDKIIIGASSASQLEQNLVDLEKGPLPDEVLEAVEKGWLRVKGVVPQYYH
ncbi:hypothetical protein LRP88_01776 [Fusarium phalaenopsidis]|nr:putative aldo keto reductase protein [Fusarium sp. Ph1]